MAFFPNQDTVIREVGKAYDHIKQLQALLHFNPRTLRNDMLCMHELAQPLFEDALQGLHHSLHVMKSGMPKIELKQEVRSPQTISTGYSSQDSVLLNDFDQRIENRRGKRKRIDNSWTCTTTMPYDDGYQWRKYGDKKITGTNSSRSYFRCTFKEEQGCMAKKIVQGTTNIDPPDLFHVTYTNKHNCNSRVSILPATPVKEIDGVYEEMIMKRDNYISPIPNNNPTHNLTGDGLSEALSGHCVGQNSDEYNVEALIMELVGFEPENPNFLLF